MLHALRSEFASELLVLHVNHHLRGSESDADESFVRSLAQELGLSVVVEQATPAGGNIEQSARDLRREFFQRARAEHALDRIALGHTRSDQAETVLFRLLRGSGLTGLAGMRPVTEDDFIRPLLASSRNEVREWAAAQDLRWRDDSSNLDTAFTRNRLRLETLPALANAYNANLEALLAQSAELAQAEEDYWNGQTAALYARLAKHTHFGVQFQVSELISTHVALRRRLIRHAVREMRGHLRGIEFEHVEAILRLCECEEAHDRVIVPGVDALRSFGQLLLSLDGLRRSQERDYEMGLEPGKACELPFQAGILSVKWLNSDEAATICANFKTEQEHNLEICNWDGDLIAPGGTLSSLCVRNWQPGDVFQRVGHQSEEKVKALFQSSKVPLWERRHWPVVTMGRQIVWVRQFGSAAGVSAYIGSRSIVRLTYRRT
jgi:tRNA(Ile)-lysidine synthase